ncbi:hypothetical protein HD806DRAFT_513323 [Xylariaceae sp. AK1471]|nr:hypothetical protein HD806DRAFT_513323 [Xylariaceae sp. AK1471]
MDTAVIFVDMHIGTWFLELIVLLYVTGANALQGICAIHSILGPMKVCVCVNVLVGGGIDGPAATRRCWEV